MTGNIIPFKGDNVEGIYEKLSYCNRIYAGGFLSGILSSYGFFEKYEMLEDEDKKTLNDYMSDLLLSQKTKKGEKQG